MIGSDRNSYAYETKTAKCSNDNKEQSSVPLVPSSISRFFVTFSASAGM